MANTNHFQLALDLRRGLWLIKDPDTQMAAVNDFLSRRGTGDALAKYDVAVSARSAAMKGASSGRTNSADKVVVIPVHTALTKYDTCGTYGTTTIADAMAKYAKDPEVAGFVLDIDSPGGSVNAIPPLVDAIARAKAAGKVVVAHCDSCYSAAYWIASQCDAIFADNYISSGFGSIGAFVQILDDRYDKRSGFKVLTIYAPESSDKNAAYREALDGKIGKMEAELSDIVQKFHAAVKSGRPDLKTDMDGVLTGATFDAAHSIAAGLADGMGSLEKCIENVFIRKDYQN